MGVSAINNQVRSFDAFSNQLNVPRKETAYVQKPTTQKKKIITVPNVIIGSLMTVGVLSLADMIIFKGKHINKLTGTATKLKNAAMQAQSAEARALSLETRAVNAEALINGLKIENTKLGDKIRTLATQFDQLSASASKPRRLHQDHPNVLKWLQNAWADVQDMPAEVQKHFQKRIKFLLDQSYYQLVTDGMATIKGKPAERFFETEMTSRITKPVTELPAILNELGEMILPGKLYFPYKA